MTIGSFSVRNSVLINILTVLILVAGLFSLNRLPQEQFAEIPFYFVNIIVPYPGVSAEDIEQNVTLRVENAMAGLQDLNEIQSTTTEGLSRVTLQFDQGLTDDEFRTRFQDVQNRFTNVDLPDGTLNATIDDFSTNDFLPVVEVALSGDVPFGILNETARNVADQLQTIPDLSTVNLIGSRDRQVVVALEASNMEAYGVSLREVVAAIQSRNVTIPAGTLRTPSREFLIRTTGTLNTVQEFRDVVVRESGPDTPGVVRLGDLGTVSFSYDEDGTAARYNGRQAISLQVTKVPGGSSVGILNEVRRRVSSYGPQIPAGIDVDYFNDSTVAIRDSLNVLVTNALMGLALLVIILLIFIGVRNALMTALGIPITFALTFIVLDAFGETLNSNTLFGLVLVLGLVVDHAIIIVENSYRLEQQKGMARHDAAIHGVNQVVLPVIAATLTTVAAFLPLTFLPGIIGKFLRVVPLTVSIALIASTFEAIVFIPSHYADWPGGRRKSRGGGGNRVSGFLRRITGPKTSEGVPKSHIRLQDAYRRGLTSLYRHRRLVVIATVLVMIGVFSLVGGIQQKLFDSEDATLYYVDIEMAPGTPISRTDEFARDYENRLLRLVGNGEVVAVNTFVGFSGGTNENVRRSNVAQIVVDLTEQDEGRTRSITEIMNDARTLTEDIAGAESVVFRKQQGGPPTDPPIVFQFFGDNFVELAAVADAVKEKLQEYPELLNISDNLDAGTPELRIRVNERRAAEYGLNTSLIGQYIRGRFEGVSAGTVFTDNEETEILVRYGSGGQMAADRLLQIQIPTGDGRRIPFSAVAVVDEDDILSSIRRIDGKRQATVTAEAYSTVGVPAINQEIYRLFEEELQPAFPGVVLEVGGEFAEIARTLQEILRVFVIGIFLIYLVLATQFKSYTQPLLILITVPFAFVGVVLFLLVSGTPLSTTVIYAGVALAGIAVNDAIVLVSFANDGRRQDGLEVSEAIVGAAVTRLRPIFLTSITTIAGLMPTALGLGGTSVVWGPMASTIIFGLVFSTLTTLVVVPSFYGLFYDRRRVKDGGAGTKMLLVIAIMALSGPKVAAQDAMDVTEVVRRVMKFDPALEKAERGAVEASQQYLLTRSAVRPDISLDIDPYGYSRQRLPGASGPTASAEISETRSAGVGLQIRQSLPTSGQVTAGVSHRFSVTESAGSKTVEQVPEVSFGLSQPLFATRSVVDTRVFSAELRAAELARSQADLTVSAGRNSVVRQGLGQFVRYAGLQRSLELNRQTVDLLKRQIDTAELDRRDGTLSENAVLALQVALNDRRNVLFDMELAAVRTEQDLVRVLGLGNSVGGLGEYVIVDDFTDIPMPETPKPDGPVTENFVIRSRMIDLERRRAQGMRNNLVDRPQLNMSVSAASSLTDYFDDGRDYSARLSVTLRIPLLTGKERDAREQIDRLAEEDAVAALDDAQLAVQNELQVLVIQRDILRRRAELLDTEVAYQKRRLKNEKDLAAAGASTDMKVAEVALDVAARENERWQVSADLFLNRLDIYALSGEDLASLLLR